MIKKKSFGQHFLKDKRIAEKIVEAADFKAVDLVVEIGPGGGALTDFIGQQSKTKSKTNFKSNLNSKLILIEADRDLIGSLEEKYPQAEVIQADAVKVDFDEITNGKSWLLIGNLPYNAASAIMMNALSSLNPPSEMIVMVQKEQADRMLALPGDRGVLSVATQLYARVERLFNVKPGSFSPPPKVQSSVLKLKTPSGFIDLESGQIEKIIKLAKLGFSSRRKQLHRNLADAGVTDSKEIKSILTDLGLPESARAEELTIKQWIKLFSLIYR